MCLKDPSHLNFGKNPALLNEQPKMLDYNAIEPEISDEEQQDLTDLRNYLTRQKLASNTEQKLDYDITD